MFATGLEKHQIVEVTGFCRIFATGMFCGPRLLFWLLLFQIRKGLGSSRFCCKDFAKLCTNAIIIQNLIGFYS